MAPRYLFRFHFLVAFLACIATVPVGGCCALCQRPTADDVALANRVRERIQRAGIPGIKQVQASASNGLVTLGGIVESPAALQRAVILVGTDPGIRDLSYLGVKFDPPEVSDEEIVARMRKAAESVLGPELAGQLGYYCEDHFGVVYGVLPSAALRDRLDTAIRNVEGIGPYFVAVEVKLEDAPSDDAVKAAVERELHSFFNPRRLLLVGSHIEVECHKNVVILKGTVKNYLARMVAEQQAKQVPGVRYVINRLEVEAAGD